MESLLLFCRPLTAAILRPSCSLSIRTPSALEVSDKNTTYKFSGRSYRTAVPVYTPWNSTRYKNWTAIFYTVIIFCAFVYSLKTAGTNKPSRFLQWFFVVVGFLVRSLQQCLEMVHLYTLLRQLAFQRLTNTHRPSTPSSPLQIQLEKARTHKSAETDASNVFCDSQPSSWTFWPQINEFPGLIVEHFYITFGDPSCIGFWDIVQKKDIHTQTAFWHSFLQFIDLQETQKHSKLFYASILLSRSTWRNQASLWPSFSVFRHKWCFSTPTRTYQTYRAMPPTFLIWNNLCDLVYQRPTRSYRSQTAVA